jgi:undecaprenyl-diphosphatase
LDWTLFHFVNNLLVGHPLLADGFEDFSIWSVPLLAVATLLLWFADRSGAAPKWKLATTTALASAGVALATNQLISHLWARPRPTAAHHDAHLFFVAPSTDPSFPSDHAGAAFAIAVAVFLISRRVGVGFLVAAAAIAFDRVLIGLHYPGDITAGALVGLGAALLIHRFGQTPLRRVVGLVSRLSDPLVRPVWTRVDAIVDARSLRT